MGKKESKFAANVEGSGGLRKKKDMNRAKNYAMDALFQKKKNGDKASVDKAKSSIEEATKCEEKRYESIGHGWDHRFEGKTIVGSCLVYREKVIHMAFFRIDETERVGTISSSSRRRRFRM